MDYIHENPFVGFGQPVTTPRLIGQENLIQKIQWNLLNGSSSFLVGLPRSGKTSVAKEVIRRIRKEKPDISCTTIFLSAVTDESDFYHDIAHDLFPDCDIFGEENDAGKRFDLFKYYLKEQGEKGFSGIVVIDEFDSVLSGKFTNRFLFINQLCELILNRESCNVTFLFLSVRSLLRFKNTETSESGIAGLCPQFYMKMLSETDIRELLKNANINGATTISNTVFKITGGQPFLTEALLYYSLDYAEENSLPLSTNLIETVRTQDDCSAVFGQYYARIRKLLSLWEDLKLWDCLCDLVVGPLLQPPVYSACKVLEHYELIDENANCFSEDFQNYLERNRSDVPLWTQISSVEIALRKLIKTVCLKKMKRRKANWIETLKKDDPFLENLFDEFEKIMKKEQKIFGLGNPTDILEYSYLGNLKEIIIHKWSWFQTYLGNSDKKFKQYVDDICKIRNPLAHNRKPELIPLDAQNQARNACEQITKLLDENCKNVIS